MTDPTRVPDVVAAAQTLPYGAAIIYRHFGSAHKFIDAESLRQITFERGQQFLIGDDPELEPIKAVYPYWTGSSSLQFFRAKALAQARR